MENNFIKIQKPSQNPKVVSPPLKTVNVPTYDSLASAALSKNKYLSEFKTEDDKQRVRENLGIGNSFKIVGEYPTLQELQIGVPLGRENEAYIVDSDIYVWSDKLNKWVKYGTAGSSAYQVAVANGFKGTEAEWLASLGRAQSFVIKDLDSISEQVLYNTLESISEGHRVFGTVEGNTYELQVSKIANGYILTFIDQEGLNVMSVRNINGTYTGSWKYMYLDE